MSNPTGSTTEKAAREKKQVALPDSVTVKKFAEILGLPAVKVITELMNSGVMASINEEIDFETASIVAEDLGFEAVPDVSVSDEDTLTLEQLLEICAKEKESGKNLRPRPPVVTVLGHVDHGKTTLLDTIRKSSVAEAEEGGITQHIRAYQVKKRGKLITFIDTPGHAAFAAMRERGVSIADIAILVVAADDGVKPQTKEVIDYLLEKKIPTIAAINKIDKPGANVAKVKQELAENGILLEGWGGDVVCNEISAKNNIGIGDLLENILLLAEVEDFRADETRDGLAVVMESHIDPKKGPVATALVKTGTLKVGQDISAGSTHGRIRRLEDHRSRSVTQAPPSMPVVIYGLDDAPKVNDVVQVMSTKAAARAKARRGLSSGGVKNVEAESDKIKLNIVLNADVQGSLEAIEQILSEIPQEKVAISFITTGVGNITESDVKMAMGAGAIIYGFNVSATAVASRMAEDRGVEIRTYKIIYELVDDIKKEMLDRLPVEKVRTPVGKLEVLAVFRTEPQRMIVGGRVLEGQAAKNVLIDVYRGEKLIGSGELTNLQHNKVDVNEVEKGNECGLTFSGQTRIKVGDILEMYTETEKEKTL